MEGGGGGECGLVNAVTYQPMQLCTLIEVIAVTPQAKGTNDHNSNKCMGRALP